MDPVDYYAVSNVIIDDIQLPDGTKYPGILGGAGTYAVAGMRLWADHVGIVSGIGHDFAQYQKWFGENGIDTAGLEPRHTQTPRSVVQYFEDGEREETPQLGYDHFQMMEPWPSHVPQIYGSARGVYIFRDDDPAYWQGVGQLRPDQPNAQIMWEIAANVASPSHWTRVAGILKSVDMFSLNRTEGARLCQRTDPNDIVDQLLGTGVPAVVLRLGADGALVADQSARWLIPSVIVGDVVDTTGAGNAYTGGFLVGYIESDGDIVVAGKYGAAAAALMLHQYGPPATLGRDLRQTARNQLENIAPTPGIKARRSDDE